MWIKSVKSRVYLIFFVFLVIMGINSLWSVKNFRELNNSIENILDSNYKSIVSAQKMIASIERQDSLQLSYLFTKDKEYIRNFTENEEEFYLALNNAKNNITELGEEEIVSEIENEYKKYIVEFENFLNLENKNNQPEYYFKEIFPKFERIKLTSKELVNINQNSMLMKRDEAKIVAQKAVTFSILLSIVTLILGIFIITYLIRKILVQFEIFIEKIDKLSLDDYSQRIPENLDAEFNNMGVAFNQMAEKLESYRAINIKRLMTEKRKAEGIVESISDGIIVTDMANNIVLVNKAAEEMLNIKEKDLLEQPFLTGIGNRKIYDSIQEVLCNRDIKSTMKELEISLETNENKVVYCKVYINSIVNKVGERLGVVTLLQDVTKAKEVEQMKDNFVSTVSHEFRTPLTSIGMAVELLCDENMGQLSSIQKELVTAIKQDNDRLKLLIKDLLDLSRLESKKTPMNFQECKMKEIIEFAVKPLKTLCENKNVTLEIGKIDETSVLADFNKIGVVLTNLLGNAIKYGKENQKNYIRIETVRKDDDMIISVKDRGRGIPEDLLEKIFNKYVQVKISNDGTVEGTGLGLAISKEIVKAHNGEIWVDSILGEGSTFYFTLKCKK